MDKKGICFLMTCIGSLIITFVQVYILIDDDREMEKQVYLEQNLINQAKKCIRAQKCEEGNITLRTLKENDYLEDKYLSLLSDYSLDSYIVYPTLEVVLNKNETAIKDWR